MCVPNELFTFATHYPPLSLFESETKSTMYVNKRISHSSAWVSFDQTILADITKLSKRDDWHGPLQVLEDWGVIALFVFLCESTRKVCWNHIIALFFSLDTPADYIALCAHLFVMITIYALTALVIGCRMRALAELLHQASHLTLCKTPWWNYFLGTVFCGWPIFYSFSVYKKSHDMHHYQLAEYGADPDYTELKHDGMYDQHRSREGLLLRLSSTVSFTKAFLYLRYVWINRICAQTESPNEKALRVVWYGSVLALVIARGKWVADAAFFAAYWLVPFLTTAAWVGNLIELFEHYPLMENVEGGGIYRTRNRLSTPAVNFFLGIHNEGYHLVHHLFAHMPAWHLPAAHLILMRDPHYAALHAHVRPGWLSMVREVLTLLEMSRGDFSEAVTGGATAMSKSKSTAGADVATQ